MITLFFKVILFKLKYYFNIGKIRPINYTISLLYSCNSRCKTCNVYKKKAENLSILEYEKLFLSIGKSPYWVTFSGGEPFLRKDIVSIVEKCYNICLPKIINIPSNGILTDWIVKAVAEISSICVKSQIIINLSIDGIGEEHNNIRNVKDNYNKVIKTYKKLKSLNLTNLSIGIHTVISKYNVENFASTSMTLMDLNPDSYITEIAEERVELDTIGKQITPNQIVYKSAIDLLIHRIKNNKFKGMNKITQAFRIEYYNLVKKILRDKTQKIPCYAGIISAQISPDGEVWFCCTKAKSMGNLRNNDFNFDKIWNNLKSKEERESIKNKECYCPLANASYTNMLLNVPTVIRVIYRSFIKWWV